MSDFKERHNVMNAAANTIKRLKSCFKDISADCLAVCIYFLALPGTVVVTPVGSLLKAVTIPIIAVLFYKLFFGKCKQLRFNAVHAIYFLYVLYTVWQLLILNTDNGRITTKDMILSCATIILMSMRVYNQKEQHLIENAWIAVGLISLYLGFFSTVNLAGTGRTSVYILGFYEDPNQFCGYFIMPVMIYAKRIVNKSKMTPIYVVLLVLSFYAMLKTGSRGGLIGVLAGIALFAVLGIKSIKGRLALISVGLVCTVFVMTVVFPLLPEDVRERYSIETVAEDKGSGRFEIWKYLIDYTTEKPERIIRGAGLFSTEQTLENSTLGLTARGAHNQFIQVFADQGAIGLMLFTAFAAVCFFRDIRKYPEYACAFAAVMALSFSLSFYVFKPYINIVIMCAMSFEENTRKGSMEQ